jgi:hypothetical protein
MNKKFILTLMIGVFFLLILSLNNVNAVGSVVTNVNTQSGYTIYYPQIDYVPQNVNFTLHIYLSNRSNSLILLNTDVSCYLRLFNSSGLSTYDSGIMTKTLGNRHTLFITSGNFSDLGVHAFFIWCNSSNFGGEASGVFQVTPNGEEATTGKAVFYIGLLFVLLFFLAISIYFFSDSENLLVRVGSIGFAYLLLISITFIAWNMAKDFLTSSPFLIQMMYIVFFVLMVGVIPLIIGMFAYYLIMITKIGEIQRLMDKGMSYGDADRRIGGKKNG